LQSHSPSLFRPWSKGAVEKGLVEFRHSFALFQEHKDEQIYESGDLNRNQCEAADEGILLLGLPVEQAGDTAEEEPTEEIESHPDGTRIFGPP
jgi:hypothetical protein